MRLDVREGEELHRGRCVGQVEKKVSRVRGQQYQSHFPIGQKNEHPAVFLIKMTFSLILPLASLHNIINHFCTILTNRFFFFTFCTVFVFDWCIDALVIIIIIMVAF